MVARASGGEAHDQPSKHSPPCRESGPTPTTDIAGEAHESRNGLRRAIVLPVTVDKNLGAYDVCLDKNENLNSFELVSPKDISLPGLIRPAGGLRNRCLWIPTTHLRAGRAAPDAGATGATSLLAWL